MKKSTVIVAVTAILAAMIVLLAAFSLINDAIWQLGMFARQSAAPPIEDNYPDDKMEAMETFITEDPELEMESQLELVDSNEFGDFVPTALIFLTYALMYVLVIGIILTYTELPDRQMPGKILFVRFFFLVVGMLAVVIWSDASIVVSWALNVLLCVVLRRLIKRMRAEKARAAQSNCGNGQQRQ